MSEGGEVTGGGFQVSEGSIVDSDGDIDQEGRACKSRRGSNPACQLSPNTHPLPTYPVSIRQQIAIIKQMEQPSEHSSTSQHNTPIHSSPATTPKRRVPKVHKKNDRGETPLHVAARKGEHRLCRRLLQEGALVNATDYAGWTALHEACSHVHFKVAKVLISGGADVNASSDSCDTPLHDAASNGCHKLVWLLLHSGADKNRENNVGKRPLDVCPEECIALKNLLTSSTLAEKCPDDQHPSTMPLTAHQLVCGSLTVNVCSPSLKAPLVSPSDTEISVHSDLCVRAEHVSNEHTITDHDPMLNDTWLNDKMDEGSETMDNMDTVTSTESTNKSLWREGDWEGDDSKGKGKPKPSKDPSPSPSKQRKQRGRRKTRGGSVACMPTVNTPLEDVYEFRSSPESDLNMEKSRETSAPPTAKRQRITVEPDQEGSVSLSTANDIDEKIAGSSRKVPPLRISLPRTPSEDGIGQGEDSGQGTSSRKRVPRTHKKPSSPTNTIDNASEETAQRVTRSKLRQSGRQLREHTATSSQDGSRKVRRGMPSNTNLSSIASLPNEDPPATVPPVPSIEENGIVSPTPMSLMLNNTYEGYRRLRTMIEGRWQSAACQPAPSIPSPLPHQHNYMLLNKTYSQGNADPCHHIQEQPPDDMAVELCLLRQEQQHKRHRMRIAHQVERERLQMQAEMNMLRMNSRKANPGRDHLSTVRILHEKDVFNSWFLDVKPEQRPVLEQNQVLAKFQHLSTLMSNRQQMESDALYAQQVFSWNKAVPPSAAAQLHDQVPRVSVTPLNLLL